jgi:PAS domain S-box-containing protein
MRFASLAHRRDDDERIRVLYIDSTTEGRASVRETLSSEFAVETAPDPETALSEGLPGSTDVVVSALQFESGDALELIEALPAAGSSRPPVVLFTEEDDPELLRAATNAGVERIVPREETPAESVDELRPVIRTVANAYRDRCRDQDRLAEYERILGTLQEGYYRTDDEGRLTMATAAIADMLGYDSPEEMVGQDVMSFYPPGADRDVVDAMRDNGGSVSNYEVELQSRDGDRVQVLTSSHIIEDDGTVTGVEGIFRDITSRKESERALKESRQRLSAIYQASPTAITLSNSKTGELVEVNEAFTEITGYEPDEAIGRTLEELGVWVDPTDREEVIARLQTDGAIDDFEFDFQARDGTHGTALLSGTIVTIGDDRYLLSTTLDISSRKRREQELELLKQVLSRLLRHNLRNDLTVIRSRAELLSDTVRYPEREHVETILDRADELRDTSEKAHRIERVLESTIGRQERDVTAYVESTVAQLREQYPQATFETDLQEGTTARVSDKLPLALEDALENAVIHNDDDPTVRVTVERRGDDVVVEVADDGPGVPETELAVLDREEETELLHGSGAGLWLMHWVVEKSNGDLTFDVDEHGTTVTMRLEPSDTTDGDAATDG